MRFILKSGYPPLACLCLVLLISEASAQVTQQSCLVNTVGQSICAPPGGTAVIDITGQVVCGPGRCATDQTGKVICSSQPSGGVIREITGIVACVRGCVVASASMCERPVPAPANSGLGARTSPL